MYLYVWYIIIFYFDKYLSDDRSPFKLAIQNNTYGYKTTNGTFVAFRSDSTATYTFSSGNGSTVDLGARNNYRYVNATNVYNKGKSDGVTTHTGTYTLSWDTDFGKTKDLGVNHTYRYISVPSKPAREFLPQGYYYAYGGKPNMYGKRTIGDNSMTATSSYIHLTANISKIRYYSNGTFILQGFNDDAFTDGVQIDSSKFTYIFNKPNASGWPYWTNNVKSTYKYFYLYAGSSGCTVTYDS